MRAAALCTTAVTDPCALGARPAFDFDQSNFDRMQEKTEEFPKLIKDKVRGVYERTYGKRPLQPLNRWVGRLFEKSEKFNFKLAASEEGLRAEAKTRAEVCWKAAQRHKKYDRVLSEQGSDGLDVAYIVLAAGCEQLGIDPPDLKICSTHSAVMRMINPKWWRGKLRKLHARSLEEFSRAGFFTHRKASAYVGVDTLKRRRKQKQMSLEALAATIIRNELGEELSLQVAAESSTANPWIRFSEMVTRMKAFDEIAEKNGYPGFFVTLTAPSKFHAVKYNKKINKCWVNKKYEDYTVREARDYLSSVWERIRAQLAREGIGQCGFRIAEPHHDGTPHNHFILFFEDMGQAGRAMEVMKHYATMEEAEEIEGKEEIRFDYDYIDRAKGSATAYLIKYISKNITGEDLDKPDAEGRKGDYESGLEGADAVERVEAWASTHGLRQWQQIGGAPVGVWRMLRKMTDEQQQECQCSVIIAAVKAAKESDYAAYTEIMGGVFASRKDHPIRLLKVEGLVGVYGDDLTVTMGVESDSASVLTKVHQWEVVTEAARSATWTRINNCTVGESDIPPVPDYMSHHPPPETYF